MKKNSLKKAFGLILSVFFISNISGGVQCKNTSSNSPVGNGTYEIVSVLNDRKALGIYRPQKSGDDKVKLCSRNDTDNQRFSLLKDKEGYYTIQAKSSGKMLNTPTTDKKADFEIIQRKESGNNSEKWKIILNNDDTYSIASKASGLYLGAADNKDKQREQLRYYKKNDTKAQKFILKKTNKSPRKFKKIDNLYCGNLENFISKDSRDNTVLLVEINPYHHECLPGYAKYFLELGYNVDVLMLEEGVDSFCVFDKTDKLQIYSYKENQEVYDNKMILRSILRKYDYVFLNTIDQGVKKVFNSFNILELPGAIVVDHSTNTLKKTKFKELLEKKRVVTLGNFGIGTIYVNPHYFGKIPRVNKNKKTNFVVVGNTWSKCRNYNQLFDAVKKLSEKSLDFKVTVFGRHTDLEIPEKIAKYFDFKGRVTYEQMYNELQNSDFILMLLDPQFEKHLSYKTTKVTGNAQLSYGFKKPPIINKEFADFYHFSPKNAIIEEGGDLYAAMEKAINCPQDQYSAMQNNLETTADKIFKESLNNLRGITNPKA